MKRIISYCLISALAFLLSCNEYTIAASEVPPAATAAFNAKYPGATNVEWITEKKEDKTIYEALFKFNGKM